jgi:hypothetical protein
VRTRNRRLGDGREGTDDTFFEVYDRSRRQVIAADDKAKCTVT